MAHLAVVDLARHSGFNASGEKAKPEERRGLDSLLRQRFSASSAVVMPHQHRVLLPAVTAILFFPVARALASPKVQKMTSGWPGNLRRYRSTHQQYVPTARTGNGSAP